MPNFIRATSAPALVGLAILVAACSGAGSSPASSGSPGPTGSGSPAASPTATAPDFGTIDHATGATDVVLRYDVGGGFLMAGAAASQAPIFTLYGDGTVVFRSQTAEMPPADGSVFLTNPYRTAKLSEEQMQDLLAFALGEGNLGVARAQYDNPMVTDVGTSTFTLDAGGLKKTVSIYALGMEIEGVPDQGARRGFNALATRLSDFDQGGSIATDVYEPTAYRGILMDGQGMVVPDVRTWPWDDIKPADFVGPADPNAFQLATRTMTPAEVAALKVKDPQGGFGGMVISGPGDGKLYSFALRPLLPDETE